jgi:hypothetical protein
MRAGLKWETTDFTDSTDRKADAQRRLTKRQSVFRRTKKTKMDNVLIFGIVCMLLFVSIGWWLTREKKEDHSQALNRLGNPFAADNGKEYLAIRATSEHAFSEFALKLKWWQIAIAIFALACVEPLLALLALVAAIGLVPAHIAMKRGHSFTNWWIYGSCLFLIALPHALWCLDDKTKRRCVKYWT